MIDSLKTTHKSNCRTISNIGRESDRFQSIGSNQLDIAMLISFDWELIRPSTQTSPVNEWLLITTKYQKKSVVATETQQTDWHNSWQHMPVSVVPRSIPITAFFTDSLCNRNCVNVFRLAEKTAPLFSEKVENDRFTLWFFGLFNKREIFVPMISGICLAYVFRPNEITWNMQIVNLFT